MKKKNVRTLGLSWLLALCLLAIASCDNDPTGNSSSPVFEELTLSPSVCYTGDSITGTVTFSDKGKKIYKTVYYYRFVENGEVTRVTWTVVAPTTYDNVTFTFVAPSTAGLYTITFGADQINYSSSGPNGELYGSASSVTATLNVRSSSSSSDDDEDEDE